MIKTNRPIRTRVTTRWVTGEGGWKGASEQRAERLQLLSTQGHLHKLELEIVLEGVGGDEAQFARCDCAGEEEEKQDRHSYSLLDRRKNYISAQVLIYEN